MYHCLPIKKENKTTVILVYASLQFTSYAILPVQLVAMVMKIS